MPPEPWILRSGSLSHIPPKFEILQRPQPAEPGSAQVGPMISHLSFSFSPLLVLT